MILYEQKFFRLQHNKLIQQM